MAYDAKTKSENLLVEKFVHVLNAKKSELRAYKEGRGDDDDEARDSLSDPSNSDDDGDGGGGSGKKSKTPSSVMRRTPPPPKLVPAPRGGTNGEHRYVLTPCTNIV